MTNIENPVFVYTTMNFAARSLRSCSAAVSRTGSVQRTARVGAVRWYSDQATSETKETPAEKQDPAVQELKTKLKAKEDEVVDLKVSECFMTLRPLSNVHIEPTAVLASRLSEPAAELGTGEGANAGLCHYALCW